MDLKVKSITDLPGSKVLEFHPVGKLCIMSMNNGGAISLEIFMGPSSGWLS